jgi:hypothetical protein
MGYPTYTYTSQIKPAINVVRKRKSIVYPLQGVGQPTNKGNWKYAKVSTTLFFGGL